MADKRAYFKLDVGYLTNPKIVQAFDESPTAVLLHIGSIAYSAQHLTDGIVPMKVVTRLSGADRADADVLLDHGLWVDVGDGQAEIHDYLEHQRSSSEVRNATDKAQRAANARWKQSGNAASTASSNASSMPTAMPREREEREKKTTGAAAPESDPFATFWDLHPKKVAKGQAAKAHKAALKKADADTILAGLKAHLPIWEKTERQFIPNPATWLNGERWADEIDSGTAADNPYAHLPSVAEVRERRGF